MMRRFGAIAAGTVVGLAIFAAAFGMWMVFGADPDKDPLLSW